MNTLNTPADPFADWSSADANPHGESIAQLLVEILTELKHLNNRLGTSAESRSSVEVKTSTRGVDIAAKSYSGSDIETCESAAVDAYFRVMAEIQQRLGVTP